LVLSEILKQQIQIQIREIEVQVKVHIDPPVEDLDPDLPTEKEEVGIVDVEFVIKIVAFILVI